MNQDLFQYAMRCPVCQGDNVHHGMVTVRSREREDQDGVQVKVAAGRAEVSRGNKNFVGRRDDIEIECRCESGCTFTLTILQHKGVTFVRTSAGELRVDPWP